jgi:hypothetical protein
MNVQLIDIKLIRNLIGITVKMLEHYEQQTNTTIGAQTTAKQEQATKTLVKNSHPAMSTTLNIVDNNHILIIPSVLLFQEPTYQFTVEEIYSFINLFSKVFTKIKILPHVSIEEVMESKNLYMNKLFYPYIFPSNEAAAQIFTNTKCPMNTFNSEFAPTFMVPNYRLFFEKIGQNNILRWIQFITQQSQLQIDAKKWKVRANWWIVKSPNGTRAANVKAFKVDESMQSIFVDQKGNTRLNTGN